MRKQRIVIAVLLSVLENRHAGRGCGCAKIKAPAGRVDQLVLQKYKTSLPPNHTRLIGKRAERGRRFREVVRACWFLDSVSGNDMQVDTVVGAARECGHYLINSTLPFWVLEVNIQGIDRRPRIERIRAVGSLV